MFGIRRKSKRIKTVVFRPKNRTTFKQLINSMKGEKGWEEAVAYACDKFGISENQAIEVHIKVSE